MAAREEIVWRGGLIYIAIGLLAVVLLIRIIILQYVQRGKWTEIDRKSVV